MEFIDEKLENEKTNDTVTITLKCGYVEDLATRKTLEKIRAKFETKRISLNLNINTDWNNKETQKVITSSVLYNLFSILYNLFVF